MLAPGRSSNTQAISIRTRVMKVGKAVNGGEQAAFDCNDSYAHGALA